jgi:hypothetical protein
MDWAKPRKFLSTVDASITPFSYDKQLALTVFVRERKTSEPTYIQILYMGTVGIRVITAVTRMNTVILILFSRTLIFLKLI